MSEKVIIVVLGGCVSVNTKPDNVELEIRDYDVEGDWDEDNESCKKDSDGDRYQEMIFPATKIKFAASGEQCFTDVKIRYHNEYRCNDCDCEWDDEWDSMCDDECPKCGTTYSPHLSTEINQKSIGWQPSPDEFPLPGLQTFEVYQDLTMGKECHPGVKDWIEISEGMIEEPVIIPAN